MSVGSRNPRIDVLRGISITLVLLHHFWIAYLFGDPGFSHLPGAAFLHAVFRNGNYAVTMFFVISGFLITSNAEKRWSGLRNVRASAFYQYRAARIIPCLLLLLSVVNVLAALKIDIFLNHPEFGEPVSFWIVDLASLTFWMNVLMSHVGWVNYALCVQWSLSIEEVFYLSFPVLCLLLRRERLLLAVWSMFIILGPIWRATHQASEYTELNSYFSCFDGIAFGCCAAVLSHRVRLPSWATTPVFYLTAIGMTWFYLSASISVTGVYGVTLMALGTTILLIAQAQEESLSPTRSALLEPMRRCGRSSYEIYLFHLVVLGGLRTIWVPVSTGGYAKVLLLFAFLTLSILLGVVVSRYYSEPLNRRFRAGASVAPGLAEA